MLDLVTLARSIVCPFRPLALERATNVDGYFWHEWTRGIIDLLRSRDTASTVSKRRGKGAGSGGEQSQGDRRLEKRNPRYKRQLEPREELELTRPSAQRKRPKRKKNYHQPQRNQFSRPRLPASSSTSASTPSVQTAWTRTHSQSPSPRAGGRRTKANRCGPVSGPPPPLPPPPPENTTISRGAAAAIRSPRAPIHSPKRRPSHGLRSYPTSSLPRPSPFSCLLLVSLP